MLSYLACSGNHQQNCLPSYSETTLALTRALAAGILMIAVAVIFIMIIQAIRRK